MLTFCSTPRRK